ncbi:serine/threonine-protein kinase Smg1 [Rhagoletis pomonella]|uniref:serine/threonine-protein kinase Smg1 n=1 Tax=Rhagoletis pomonella TaxID=28610 RepID=UPI0017801F76|nr:serine/threonine-protein kinase Smg1 [Rhagoletis pomonella]
MSDDRRIQDVRLGGSINNVRTYSQHNNLPLGEMSSTGKMPSLIVSHIYGEDMKISKLLRRLQSENNAAAALELCNKLEIAVRAQANATYICRTFDLLMDNMITVLKQCPEDCLAKASTVMGVMGYINRNDFPVYKNYIMKSYQGYKSIRKYIMLALKTTFSCDAVNLDLSVYSERLLIVLKDYLENAEVANTFIAVCEAIVEFSKNYKRAFEAHFTDIVDIIVGWHLEAEQPANLKLQCSVALQTFAPYFLKELDFTFGLLGQFLEDIVALGDEISQGASPTAGEGAAHSSQSKVEMRIGCFIGAFNSILKSLSNRMEFVGIIVGQNIVNEAAMTIFKTAEQTLMVALVTEDTIMNINDFFCLLFSNNYDIMKLVNIEDLIALQMKQLHYFSDSPKLSLLYLILCVFRQLRTKLPLSAVTLVFETTHNPLATIKFTNNDKLRRMFLKVYHEILMIKNVPLLQETYRHITADMFNAIAILNTHDDPVTENYSEVLQAESTLNFCLTALSVLATQTSSIISMYALHPSILELLITNCKAGDIQMWQHYPTLHNALLNVLVVHCQKNHNFRPTSRLLTEPLFASKHALDENNSPTSENFSLILQFLAEILCAAGDLNVTNLNLLLDWVSYILIECRENAAVLEQHTSFVNICKSISQAAFISPLKCAKCIEIVLEYASIDAEVLEYFRDVATIMLDVTEADVRRAYTTILGKLPLTTCLTSVRLTTEISARKSQLNELVQWYRSTAYYAPMRNKYFKPFLERIENDKTCDEYEPLCQYSSEVFSKCWVARYRENSTAYEVAVRRSCHALALWVEYEAARQCVCNKLRTTIGKPQETFLAIEAIISKYARILSTKSGLARVCNVRQVTLCHLMSLQRNTRLLLGFIDSLEKHIYNAAEGTAFAIPALDKPIKTFFRINAHTCNEWLNRIRPSVNLIAMHSMMPELVIRNSEAILRMDKLSDVQLEHTIVTMVWALLCCDEPYTLQGLHIWLKSKHPKVARRCVWILYAAEQASGNKEQAADNYEAFLAEHESNLDVRIKDFVVDQLIYCLHYTSQWARCHRMHARYKKGQKPDGFYFELAEALVNDYESEARRSVALQSAIMDLSNWSQTDRNDSRAAHAPETFSYDYITHQLQDACVTHALKWDAIAAPPLSEEVQECIRSGVQELPYHNSVRVGEHRNAISEIVVLNHVAQKLSSGQHLHVDKTNDICSPKGTEKSTFLLKSLLWTLLFEHRKGASADMPRHYSLYLDVANSARHEGNSGFCRSMLQRFFRLKGFEDSLSEVSRQLRENEYTVSVRDADLIRGFSELAKCSYINSANQMNAISLGAAFCTQIIQQIQKQPHATYPSSSADMLLTLADWLSPRVGVPLTCHSVSGPSLANNNVNAALALTEIQELLQHLPDVSEQLVKESADEAINTLIPPAEKAIGKMINASICQQRNSCDAWFAYGNWCYRWGKRLMDAKNTNQMKSGLPQREMHSIRDIMGGNVSDDEINQVVSVLNGQQLSSIDAEEDIEKSELSSSELIEHALRRVDVLADKPSEQIASIIKIWRQAHRSIYVYYEMATKAYFNYLSIGNVQCETKNAPSDCTSVTVTLRLLRLIVKYAAGLQDVLEEGLRNTPLRPWKVIIPQLFSRLNHHEPYVRKSVSDLLCRLAQDRPHLIIFPAVVGAHQESKESTPISDNLFEENNTGNNKEQKCSTPLSNCFRSLLQTLSQQAPDTVAHVQLLVRELKRVTLLWEEYWAHSLSQLYSEYSAHFNALEAELKKAGGTATEKIMLKYSILMNHVVYDMQRIAAVTSKTADTNYERNFQERYSALVASTINELNQPFNPAKPFDGWVRIKQLYSVFQQRSLRGYASTLKIADLSPALENMRNTAISMPGVDTYAKDPVYIRSVDSAVHILPTKTKPKKLAFYGSDGRKYTYLFKGLEDLHLDERIMQFLSISNSMMARTYMGVDSLQRTRAFKAHHYSVIPLGSQSGLISWVDGVTPLFAIYKKWQQRDAALKQQQKERQATQQGGGQHVDIAPIATRPSELFYSKLTPLLAEQGLKITDPRKQWPLATLRRVLEELIKETPRDLLAKELWCFANTAVDWRNSVRSYALSMSVMSVIGYVIGLGDRHLDNVLINLTSGEIVHIDYNVCFEKGKTLRVPEKVPFRMTPNLEDALGITGIEGTFRLGCEHVLKILRKERETLLTLLEAFVYDPLVDWTVSDDGTSTVPRATSAHAAVLSLNALDATAAVMQKEGSAKVNGPIDDTVQRRQNWECTRQSLEMRLNELKPYWIQYRDELQMRLTEIEGALDHLIALQAEIRREEQERDRISKQWAMIRELQALGTAMGSHALNTITDRHNTCKHDKEAFTAVKENVQKYQKDTFMLLNTYFERLLTAYATNELSALQMQLCDLQHNVPANEFELLRTLLEQSNQEQLYAQCDFTRKEMDNTLYQQCRCALECIDLLQQYTGVMQFYPRSRLLQNRLVKYEKAYRELISDELSMAELQKQLEEWQEGDEQVSVVDTGRRHIVQYANGLEKVWIEANMQLATAINDLNEHSNQVSISFDAAVTTIHTFIALNPASHTQALQSCMLETLSKANDSLLLFEQDAFETEDLFLLNQQLNFLEMLHQMCQVAFPEADQQYYDDFLSLSEALQSLHKLKTAFELTLPERIVRLFMQDNVEEVRTALAEICAYQPHVAESALQLNDDSAEVTLLFNEIYALFDDFESRVRLLKPTVELMLENMNVSNFKQFVQSHYLGNTIDDIAGSLKYEVIVDIFRSARDNVFALVHNDVQRIYDVRRISAPLSNYINTLQRSILCGLPSLFAHMLLDTLTALSAQCLNLRCLDATTLLNAGGLCQNLLHALQQGFSGKNFQIQVLLRTKLAEHCALVGSAHYWLNEVQLQQSDTQLMYGFPKDKLLKSVQACSQSLSVWKHTMIKIHEDVDEYTAAVTQPLNWALQTNSSLLPLQENFMECVKAQVLRYNALLQLTTQMYDYANALLQFELLQSKENRLQADNAFLAVLQQWQDAMDTMRQSNANVTPIEQSIVQLLDPEGKVDQCWIQNVAGLLDEMTFTVQRKLATLEHEEEALKEGLFEQGQQMLPLLEHQVRSDMRQLFKAITKNDRNVRNSAAVDRAGFAAHARDLQHALRFFHNKLNELQMQLLSRNTTDTTPIELKAKVRELLSSHEQNYAALLDLGQRFKAEDCESSTSSVTVDSPLRNRASYAAALEGVQKSTTSNREEVPAITAVDDVTGDKKAATTNNPGEQKRNAYAVSVWKRVRMKLEGRDPDSNRRCTIAEQVDYIIREAMNPDNLAVLYEGWTPWV